MVEENEETEENTEEQEEQETTETEDASVKEKEEAEKLIADANAAAERLEGVNKELGSLLKEKARLQHEEAAGGSAEAGKESKKLTDEEKATEEARKLLAGTGYDDELFPKEEK